MAAIPKTENTISINAGFSWEMKNPAISTSTQTTYQYKGDISFPESVFTPIVIPNATSGTIAIRKFLTDFEGLNTGMAPAQRPIIKLPQYNETYGATLAVEMPPNSCCLNNSGRLLAIVTSTPT